MRLLLALLLTGLCATAADPKLVTFTSDGGLIAITDAAIRPGGVAIVNRSALFAASHASVMDSSGILHHVLWVTGEDTDADVAEVWIGRQAPPGPDAATRPSSIAFARGHSARIRDERETGADGILSRIECSELHGELGTPLYDEHGLFAGWHLSRTVDGKVFNFAIPLSRLAAMSGNARLTLTEWNALHRPDVESTYSRALGHLWVEDIEGALYYLKKALNADPENARVWLQLGFAQGKAGHGTERIFAYRKAVELDPRLESARYLLGINLLMNGDRDGAETQLEALEKLSSPYALRLKQFLDALHVDRMERKNVRHDHNSKA